MVDLSNVTNVKSILKSSAISFAYGYIKIYLK